METVNTDLNKTNGDIDFFEYYKSLYRQEYVEMTKEEAYELINKAQNGDKEAFNTMILRNLALVIKYAYLFSYAGDIEDLIQQGVFGLMKAVNNFDTSTNYAFSTYAYHWIRQSITRYINECGSSIRKPVHLCEKLRKYKKIMANYGHNGLGSDKYVFDDKYKYALKHGAIENMNEFIAMEDMVKDEFICSLDYKLSTEDGSTDSILEFITDENVNIEEDYIYKQRTNKIMELMYSTLKEKQIKVLELRFGLGEYPEPMTLEEVGQILGITRERVRQIQKKAIQQLQSSSRFYEL